MTNIISFGACNTMAEPSEKPILNQTQTLMLGFLCLISIYSLDLFGFIKSQETDFDKYGGLKFEWVNIEVWMRTSSINEYFSSRVRLPKAIVYNHKWRHHRFCPRIPIKSPKGHVASLCWPLRDCPNGSWRHDREKRSKGRRNPSATALSAKPKPQPKRKVFGRSSKMIRWCEQKNWWHQSEPFELTPISNEILII